MAIPANAAHKDGGWEFIQYIMSYDAYLKFCVEYNQMSVRKDVALDPSYIENPNAVYTFMDCTENTKWGFTRPTTEGYPTVSLLIAEMAEKIGTNQAPVEEIIKSFEDQLIADFGEDKVDIRK
jgi:multiple sugar transport system substrate-binding protein